MLILTIKFDFALYNICRIADFGRNFVIFQNFVFFAGFHSFFSFFVIFRKFHDFLIFGFFLVIWQILGGFSWLRVFIAFSKQERVRASLKKALVMLSAGSGFQSGGSVFEAMTFPYRKQQQNLPHLLQASNHLILLFHNLLHLSDKNCRRCSSTTCVFGIEGLTKFFFCEHV